MGNALVSHFHFGGICAKSSRKTGGIIVNSVGEWNGRVGTVSRNSSGGTEGISIKFFEYQLSASEDFGESPSTYTG